MPGQFARPLAGPVLAIAVAFACTACLAREAQAQPARAKQPAAAARNAPSSNATQNAKVFAKLQAKSHRIMAKIVEAESADNPDQAKLEKLYADLQKVEEEMWALGGGAGWGAGYGPGYGAGWGRGYGAGWGRGGGRGYGAGWGRGGGRGYGAGWGRGGRRGGGAGWGRGRAAWGGRGPGWRGPGAPRGKGANVGNCLPGQCDGPYWSDKDGNGVCDAYEGNPGAKRTPPPKKKK
jgi:hypothetical protein